MAAEHPNLTGIVGHVTTSVTTQSGCALEHDIQEMGVPGSCCVKTMRGRLVASGVAPQVKDLLNIQVMKSEAAPLRLGDLRKSVCTAAHAQLDRKIHWKTLKLLRDAHSIRVLVEKHPVLELLQQRAL
jgi:hypothetical protein